MHHEGFFLPLGWRARVPALLLATTLLLAVAGCGQPPTAPTANVPDFTGQQPVAGSTDARGHIDIVSDASSVRFGVDVSDSNGNPVSGATVSYDEVGTTAVFVATNPNTGARSIYVKDLAGVAPSSGKSLAPQALDPISITLSLAVGAVPFYQSQAIAQKIGITIDQLPQASPQDGIVEMCMTPMQFASLTQSLAMSQAREIAAYSAWGQSLAFGFAEQLANLPSTIHAALKIHGMLMDIGDLGEVFTTSLADELERETLREFNANSLGAHGTVKVTFFDFRHQTLLAGTEGSYAWSTALVTGLDCDPAAFGTQVGSVSFANNLSNVARDEDKIVAVQIDPPDAGVKVYLHEAFTDGTTGARYDRRYPAAVTTSNGRATFSVPPNENGTSVLTATVPSRYASAQHRLTWTAGPNGSISPPIYNFDVSGFRGIVDKPVDFTYAIGNGGDLATCEVDWGDGNGWTPFKCPPRGLFGYSLTAARTLSHTYINTGIVSPRFRFTNQSGLTSETYTELSITVPHHNTPPTIDDATIANGHLSWTFRDPDVHDDFACELMVQDPGQYLSRAWRQYPCSRSDSAPVDLRGASVAIFRVSDGTASDSKMIGVDVNNAPQLTSFAADPSPVAAGSPTTFSWSVSDPDGDPVTCGLDVNSDGTDDYTLTGTDCSPGGSQAHTYTTTGSVQAILTVDDGRGGSAVATTTVKVEAPANLPPTARLTIRPGQQIEVGQQLTADAGASSDPDGTIVAYHFTDSRGNSHDGTATWTPPAYTVAGHPQVCVEVTDNDGATNQTCQTVQVVQPAPTGPDLVLAEYALPGVVPAKTNFPALSIDEGAGFDLSATWTNLGDPVPDGTSFDFQLLRDGTPWKRHAFVMSNGQPVGNIERFNGLGAGLPSGSYAVSMVIDYGRTVSETDEGNNSASFSLTVNNLPPSADFSHGTQCLTATFTDASTDPGGPGDIVAWDWDFGDGTTSNSENPKHTYGSANTYNAKLRVTDRSGAQSGWTTHTVVVAPCVGSLTVTISGLPSGVNGDVDVTGPNAYHAHLTVTGTLRELDPGDYTITAHPVTNGADTYAPSPASKGVTVTGGGSTSQPITYSKVTQAAWATSPTSLPFSGTYGSAIASKPIQIQNVGTASGSYALSAIPSWVTIASGDRTGTVASGGSRTIQVGVSACPASTSTSSTHDQGTITVGGDGSGTTFDVSRTCDPLATTTLDLTIENVNSSTPWTASSLRVQLYSDSGYTAQVASKMTSTGTVSFTGLAPATYYYTVFKPAGSGLLAEEYWGKGSADVSSDASVTFRRWMPYLDTSTLSITWDAAQNLFHVSVTARYPSASGSAYNLRLHGIADVNKASPWDGEATSSTASITAGGSATLSLDLTGGSGTNCFYFALQTNEGGYLTTDQDGPWTTTRCQNVTPHTTLSSVTHIDAGRNYSLAVTSSGAVYGWGLNLYGRLGDGTTTDRHAAVATVSLGAAQGVAAGSNHSLAIVGGAVYGWGENSDGELGDGTTTNRSTPVESGSFTQVIQVDAGNSYSMALRTYGNVFIWGLNYTGTPTMVTGITGVTAIAAGANHKLALLGNGTVYAWGSNGAGELGDGTYLGKSSPVQVSGLSNVVGIAAGDSFSLAVDGNGAVWAWGQGSYGQLGNGGMSKSNVPVRVSGISTAVAVAAGYGHGLALLSNGTVKAWGFNSNGQLGDGSTTLRSAPVTVSGLSNVTAISAHNMHSLALLGDTTVRAWGYNQSGQLGDGSTTDRHTPVTVVK